MKTFIVYVNGTEQPELIKAGSHNAAEKKAKKKYGPSEERLQAHIRVNPTRTREVAFNWLTADISVAYTEV